MVLDMFIECISNLIEMEVDMFMNLRFHYLFIQ
jgi:hypothetical protein